MATTLLAARRLSMSTLLLCLLSGGGNSLLSQSRDFNAERIVLDDNAGDGTRNTLTLQVPGSGLNTNRTITFPDGDGIALTFAGEELTAGQLLFGGSGGQAEQSSNLFWMEDILSVGGTISATSTGTAGAGIFAISNSGSNARAVEITSDAANDALHVEHSGSIGNAGEFRSLNPANDRDALHVEHAGIGPAGDFGITNSGSSANTLNARTSGTGDAVSAVNSGTGGRAGNFRITNAANANTTLQTLTNGTGDALTARNTGTAGSAAQLRVTNATNSSIALDVRTDGLGSAGRFRILNDQNPDPALVATTNVEDGLALFVEGWSEVHNGNLSLTNTGRAGELRLYESADAGNFYTAFVAEPQSSTITYYLPTSISSGSGSVLTMTDLGSGDASLSWVNLGGQFWNLSGNAITGGQVLGTTNAQDLNIIAGNSTRITIDDATGNVGIGGAFSGTDKLAVTGSAVVTGALDGQGAGNTLGDGTAVTQLTIEGVQDAIGTETVPDATFDLAVTGDIGATGIIKSGAGIVVDGVSSPRQITSDNAMTIGVATGDLAFSGDNINVSTLMNGSLFVDPGTSINAPGNAHTMGTSFENALVLTIDGSNGGVEELQVNGDAAVTGRLETGSTLINGATAVANSRLAISDGHVTSQQTTAPTAGATGGGAHISSVTLANATDVAGAIDITTSGTPAAGTQITVTFNAAYNTAPIVSLTPANIAAAGVGAYVAARTTTGFTVGFLGLPDLSTSHQFLYQVIETQ